MKSTYLGDGVYIEETARAPGMLKLYTSNGIEETNVIWLEPEVIEALILFLESGE